MKKKKLIIALGVILVIAALAVVAIITPGQEKTESIQEVMKDAVLHEDNKVDFFGLEVNPSVYSGFIVTAALLIFAAAVRIFVIPRFKTVPGKFQLLLEELVKFFDNLAKTNSPHKPNFVGAYIFSAGVYIFVSTIFELFGVPVVTTAGSSISLPAPLSDINAAISLGCLSYIVILIGGIVCNGIRGAGSVLKDFSLPISMSFRLFGALLSGLLVTELVYYTISLSFVLPVVVAVLFTLIHALVQTYVLTMLVSMFYGEAVEPHQKKEKKKKNKVAA